MIHDLGCAGTRDRGEIAKAALDAIRAVSGRLAAPREAVFAGRCGRSGARRARAGQPLAHAGGPVVARHHVRVRAARRGTVAKQAVLGHQRGQHRTVGVVGEQQLGRQGRRGESAVVVAQHRHPHRAGGVDTVVHAGIPVGVEIHHGTVVRQQPGDVAVRDLADMPEAGLCTEQLMPAAAEEIDRQADEAAHGLEPLSRLIQESIAINAGSTSEASARCGGSSSAVVTVSAGIGWASPACNAAPTRASPPGVVSRPSTRASSAGRVSPAGLPPSSPPTVPITHRRGCDCTVSARGATWSKAANGRCSHRTSSTSPSHCR